MTLYEKNGELEQIVQKVVPRSVLLRSWQLEGGSSAQMTVLEISGPDGRVRKMIVRWWGDGEDERNLQAAANEFRLLRALRPAGLAVPAALYLDLSGEIVPSPYLVLEYVEGAPEFAPTDLDDCTYQLAAHLAQIHSIGSSNLDLLFLPRQTKACAEIQSKQPYKVDELLGEGRIREALASPEPLGQRNASVLLHGDFWPGNVLWRDGRIAAVIDWEDATLGDPLTDLAISRLDIGWIFGIEAMQVFTHHYRSIVDVDFTHLPYWDLCAALRLIRLIDADLAEWVAFFVAFGRQDITEGSMRADIGLFIAQALEKLSTR